ncbi:MAG TPA: transposase [Pyrinomonadaceae bacterium]|nr:transposase [Pyrinomonadaceae bacterium]
MTVVAQILDRLSGVAKPQRKFLVTLFTTMLVTRTRLNFSNLSRHSSLNEKTYRRQFRQAFVFGAFNQAAIAGAIPEQHTQLFAQDASFAAKSGKHTYGLDHFWNGCASRAERGLEVSLISIVSVEQNRAFALSAEQTVPRPEIKRNEQPPTRIDFYLAHLQRTTPYFPPAIKYGVFDGFYAKEKFVTGVCAAGYQVISKLRSDAALRYLYEGEQKKRGRRRRFDGKVDFHDLSRFEPVSTELPHVTLYALVVWSVSLRRRLRVVVAVNRKEPEKPRFAVLFSTDTELSATDIFRFYKARFQIEFIFRDAKQFAGFSDCQARDKEALHFHFNASVTAVNVARLLAQAEAKTDASFVFSMASIKQRAFNEHLLNLIISELALEPTTVINHPQFEYLRNYAAIAA